MHDPAEYTKACLIREACAGHLTARQVASRLGMTRRGVFALKARYRVKGDQAFIHGNTGRSPAHRIPDDVRARIVALKRTEPYTRANFTHFTELLRERGLAYSVTAVTGILQAVGIKSPKCRRPRRITPAHPPRPRRECEGEMLQADGSPYDWLGTGELSTLHGFIDDATSTVTGLYLERNECLLGYLEVLRQTVTDFGVPAELYPDKAGVFVNGQGKDTQLGAIMKCLGVDMHPAPSPQAKGRIERLWGTLQGRLPVEFARRGIKTIEAANAFLPSYVRRHNLRFTVAPARPLRMFVRPHDLSFLDTLLAVRIGRTTNAAGVFSFHNIKFLITAPVCRGKKITLLMSERLGIKAMLGHGIELSRFPVLYDIQFCDYYDNRHLRTRMPAVTRDLLARYLTAPAKETTRPTLPGVPAQVFPQSSR